MTLDWLIFLVALVVGLKSRVSLLLALWLLINIYLWSDYLTMTKWSALKDWAFHFALKDFALMLLAGYLRTPLIIVYALAASCIFHQVVLMQILTYNWHNVTLFEYRSDFMLVLAVIMLATVIHSRIGGGNGGKRVRDRLISCYRNLGRVFYVTAQEAKR